MDTNQNVLDISLFDEFELEKLPLKEQLETLSSMSRAVMTAVVARVLPMLDEQSKKELDKMLKWNKSLDEVLKFLNEKISNFQQIFEEELVKFKKEAVQFYQGLK